MPRAEKNKQAENDPVVRAIKNAKAKDERLKLMKTRNEHYLAENREDHDRTEEL
jgi:hypothetical protein